MTNPNVNTTPDKLQMRQCYDLLNLISIEGQHLSDVSFSLGELIDSGYDSLTEADKETIVQRTAILNELVGDINFYFSRYKKVSSLLKNHHVNEDATEAS